MQINMQMYIRTVTVKDVKPNYIQTKQIKTKFPQKHLFITAPLVHFFTQSLRFKTSNLHAVVNLDAGRISNISQKQLKK